MPPPVPRGPPALPAPPRRLIYDILRGPQLSGSDCITSYFMHRHSCSASHLQTQMPHEEEICFLLQKNKPSLVRERTPAKTATASSLKDLKQRLCAIEEVLLN